MAEEALTQNEATPNTEDAGNLPSEQTPSEAYDGFQITDEIKEKFKDGKLNGRFSNMTEVLEKLKEAEDFKSNTIREQTEAQKNQEQQQTEEQKAAQQSEVAQTTIMSLMPEFQANGMELTQGMIDKAVEAGIDVRDFKLGAIEFRDRANAAYTAVGGKEEYDNMMGWAKESLSDSQKSEFDKDLVGNMSSFAIKGLHMQYKEAVNDGTAQHRIEGETTFNGIKPYADRKELYADRNYLQSPRGKRDTAANNRYRARLNITPNEVIGIH